MDEQGADGTEFGEMFGVAEPAAGVHVGIGRGIGDALVGDGCESGVAKKLGPFGGGEQVRGDFQLGGQVVGRRPLFVGVGEDAQPLEARPLAGSGQ